MTFLGQNNVHLALVETKGEYCRWLEGQTGSNGRLWGGTTKIARMARFWKLLRNIRSAFVQKKDDMVVFWGAA